MKNKIKNVANATFVRKNCRTLTTGSSRAYTPQTVGESGTIWKCDQTDTESLNIRSDLCFFSFTLNYDYLSRSLCFFSFLSWFFKSLPVFKSQDDASVDYSWIDISSCNLKSKFIDFLMYLQFYFFTLQDLIWSLKSIHLNEK